MQNYILQATQCLKNADMAGLEMLNPLGDSIARAMEKLGAAQEFEYAPELEALRAQLGALVGAMDASKTELSKTIQSTSTHQRAARAYLSSPEA